MLRFQLPGLAAGAATQRKGQLHDRSQARKGANRITIADADPHGLDATAEATREAGAQCQALIVDLRSQREVEYMVRVAVDRAGSLDVLVNNAGVFDSPFVSPTGPRLRDFPRTHGTLCV